MASDAAHAAAAEVKAAAETYNWAAACAAVERLSGSLGARGEPFPSLEALKVMRHLRTRRWFDLMEQAGDAFMRSEVDDPTVQCEYAQALIDSGRITAAVAVLSPLLDATSEDVAHNTLVRSLLGRAHKQIYVDAGAPHVERNQRNLRTAAGYYHDTYRLDPPRNHWQGINAVALAARAERDGIALEGVPEAETLAAEILGSIERREAADDAGKWEYATAVEASVALGDLDGALEWAGQYVKVADAFSAAGTKRQLEEVWSITADGEFAALLGILASAALLGEEGLQTSITPAAGAALREAVDKINVGERLERMLGTAGVQSLRWYREGLRRSEAVALISDDGGRGVGSGFLIRGADLCSHLPPDELFVLTNAHIISDDHVVSGTLYPDDARVSFEALNAADGHEVTLLWTSPPGRLDTSVLRLNPPAPSTAEPMPIANHMPRLDQRVYIIGHPLGGGLSFSLQDNMLLDIVEPKLHYRTPTEPGSSGSGVFDERWKIVAIHHAGSDNMPRLTPVEGELDRYPANEGIALTAIREQLEQDLGPSDF